jgi:hypothetical protein
MGSAVVTQSYIRLTPAEAGHEGALWSKNKMPFKEWEMELQFKVSVECACVSMLVPCNAANPTTTRTHEQHRKHE